MAVGKRLRYEVLRRDNHTCRYCGRSAPEVRLTVDHVLPVALGGRDEAENLVACCSDCNSGKTSTTPDAPLIADVKQDALRWSAAMHVAIEQASADLQAQLAYRERFLDAWQAWKVTYGGSSKPIPLDEGWESSVEMFRARGLSIEQLLEDVRTAMGANHVKSDNTFRYLCGIAWKQIEKIDSAARAIFDGVTQESAPSLDERLAASAVETAALAWRAQWAQAHGEWPPEGLENEVRAYAAELLPEEALPWQVVAAAERAGERGSAEIANFIDEDGDEY